MSTTLPTGHALRSPAAADADAVAALLRARDRADLGPAEVTADEVLAEWEAPELDLARDAWVVAEPGGELLGYGLLAGSDVQVAVHPDAAGRGIGPQLLGAAERQARAGGARVLRQFVPTSNTAARVLLLEAGWWPVHHYFRMQMELKHAPEPPEVLARAFDPERDTEAVWHLVHGAYSDVEGHLLQSLEGWRATGIEQPGWDPDLWLLLHDARGIVGAALGEKGTQRTGMITTLAVAHRARGAGHGRTLLALLLAAFRRKRLRSAEAPVHGPTAAAARVFESVGMEPAWRSERWERVLGD